MHQGQMVFSQVMNLLSWKRFQTCVNRYHGDSNTHALSTQAFFKIMVFAPLTGRESLRETVLCLNAVPSHLYHLGLPKRLKRSNIAYANHQRHWKIFYDFAMILLAEARTLYQTTPLDFDFDTCVYSLDSTMRDGRHQTADDSRIGDTVAGSLFCRLPSAICRLPLGENARCPCHGCSRLGGWELVCDGSRFS